jgi:hypothetical protein
MTISNPQLAPGVHFFERDESQIQIGINPSSAIILDKQIGKQIFQLLSGNNSVAQICLELNQAGFTESSGKNLLIQLANLGLLISGPTTQTYDDKNPVSGLQRLNLNRETVGSHQAMKARIACEIAIHGAGRLGTTLGLLLASSGYPNITVRDSQLVREDDLTPWGASRVDIGNRRDHTARNLMERMIRGASSHKNSLRFQAQRRVEILLPDQRANFPWIAATSADAFAAKDISYLFAATSSSASLVSSIITPGQQPCLRCLHLHRCDQDCAWPRIELQVAAHNTVDTAPIALIIRTALLIQAVLNRWVDADLTDATANSASSLTQLGLLPSQDETYPTYFHPACGCRLDLSG